MILINLCHIGYWPGVVASGSIAWKSGMRDRAIAGQVVQKCTSSSTAFLHNFQNLWSGGIPAYLPVSISNGAVPPLSHASKDRCALHLILSVYPSGSYCIVERDRGPQFRFIHDLSVTGAQSLSEWLGVIQGYGMTTVDSMFRQQIRGWGVIPENLSVFCEVVRRVLPACPEGQSWQGMW